MDTPGAPVSRVFGWKLVSLIFLLFLVSGLCQAAGVVATLPMAAACLPSAFAMMAVVARLGDSQPAARPVGLVLLWATLSALALGSLALVVLHVVEPASLRTGDPDIAFTPGGEERLSFMMGLLALAAATTLLGLFRAVRKGVHDIIPLDPELYSHGLAFASAIAVSLFPLLPLFVLGKPPLPLPANVIPDAGAVGTPSVVEHSLELMWFGVVTLIIAGPGSGRSWSAVKQRLGLHMPPRWVLGVAVVAGVTLALVRLPLLSLLSSLMSQPVTPAMVNPWLPVGQPWLAALILSVMTATGAELTYRGLLQPRLGLVLANLVFTAPMAWTDTWNVLFVFFGAGLVFGWLRSAGGTTAAWVAHLTFLLATSLRGA